MSTSCQLSSTHFHNCGHSIAGPKARKRLYDSKDPVPVKTFEKIASGTDLSANKMATVAREFRSSQGRKSIESGLKEPKCSFSSPKILQNCVHSIASEEQGNKGTSNCYDKSSLLS